MPDWLTAALTSTVVSTALVGILVFLFQNLLIQRLQAAVRLEYEQKLETHKAKLKAESDVAQERLRAQLQIDAAKANVTFIRLHERRFESIETVYDKLQAVYHALQDRAISVMGAAYDSGIDELRIAMADFQATYPPLLVLLPESMEGQIKTLSVQMDRMSRKLDQGDNTPDEERYERWQKEMHVLLNAVNTGFYAIKGEMRKLLGEPVSPAEDNK